jgi:hypothetical protein
MRYVLANALRGNEFDPFDPVIERELTALRDRCRYAKEDLSTNTATIVPVRLDPADHGTENIRLIRGELEDLLRGPLLTSMDLVRDAVHRAGLDIGDIGRVLLTGGGGAIPLVAELVSTEFGLPVVAAPEPGHTSALGAAALAADLLSATVERTPVTIGTANTAGRAKTDELPAVPRRITKGDTDIGARMHAQPITEPTLPGAPTTTRRTFTGRRRAAVIAGAALVLGILATGTVAISTGAQSDPAPPATSDQTSAPSASVVADTTASGTGIPPGGAPKDSPAGSQNQPKSDAAQPVSTTGSTVATVSGQSANDQPAQGQPAQGQPVDQPTQGQPAPAAPQPPAGSPAPQPQPQPQPLPQPQNPPVVIDPVDTLGDTVGGVVSALPKIPGGR